LIAPLHAISNFSKYAFALPRRCETPVYQNIARRHHPPHYRQSTTVKKMASHDTASMRFDTINIYTFD
jgi:hypothetical protein